MRLFFIRHGETEHNVAGLLAGVTDSRLTNHGVLQTQRLATYLVDKRQLRFSQVFASDLQRALRTATAICDVQSSNNKSSQITPTSLALIRERDFGSFELLPWHRSQQARQNDPVVADSEHKPKETKDEMKVRANAFLDDYLLPLLVVDEESEQCVAVVSHGLFLAALWRALLLRFKQATVSLKQDVILPGKSKPLEYVAAWSNTGFLELDIQHQPAKAVTNIEKSDDISTDTVPTFLNATMQVCGINSKEHLMRLKRARGGLGSSASDDKQKRLDNFFKISKPTTCSEHQCGSKNCTNCCLTSANLPQHLNLFGP
ncbi:hypothetical protein LTR05_003731 [Lithohypha guttulata]|uniref:Uncharacterized protein n=1 Tax=Lithohypha guttulata TaxID=1690604 RepID=A0AAN7Y6Q2_9EURO|nr:hypothetical protein LTR05_003731 [Lithohypha guttulata]